MKNYFKELFNKFLRNQRLIPVIDINQNKLLAETRRWQMESELISSLKVGVSEKNVFGDRKLIVSLTSYGRRLYDVAYTIQSLMRQTVKPNKIILWIDEEDKNNIPAILNQLCSRGLEIRITPERIRSYKKLYHSLIEFPNDVIITVDDDIIYEFDLIERLVDDYIKHPNCICSLRCHRILFDSDGTLMPYNNWQWYYKDPSESSLNFLTGIGGVLYPPHSLDHEVLNIDAFTKLAPYADDVWFFCMAIKNGTKIRKVASRNPSGNDFVENFAFHDEGLQQLNTKGECMNDKQLRSVLNKYDLQPLIHE